MPDLSVIMPVYNGEAYLCQAIDSILKQTFRNFEFIIFSDASTDGSEKIIHAYEDSRIKFVRNTDNQGNYPSRNKGLKMATGKYICVMDADDVAYPHRFDVQYRYLENHPDVLAVGTHYDFSIQGKTMKRNLPLSYEDVQIALLSDNHFLHSSLMVRTEAMRKIGGYDEKYVYSSDYDLLSRLALSGKIENLPDILMMYRLHDTQISQLYKKEQKGYADEIRRKYQIEFVNRYKSAGQLAPDEWSVMYPHMGRVISFYTYACYTREFRYEQSAIQLLDHILEKVAVIPSLGLEQTLCGIGCGLIYLLRNGFTEGDEDVVLDEFDRRLFTVCLKWPENEYKALSGWIHYLALRIELGKKNARELLNKQSLINFMDRLESRQIRNESLLKDIKKIEALGIFPERTDYLLGKRAENRNILMGFDKLMQDKVTFVIPVRIDSLERQRNLDVLLEQLSKRKRTDILILEADISPVYKLKKNYQNVSYRFVKDDHPVFYRTKYLNLLLHEANASIVGVWDTDVMLPDTQIDQAIEDIREGKAVMSFPYDGKFCFCSAIDSFLFRYKQDINDLKEKELKFVFFPYSVGGAFLVNKDVYLKAGGENEHFYGWGMEDLERVKRMEILGLPVTRAKGALYHLFHFRNENSRFYNETLENESRAEYLTVCSLTKNRLEKYIQTWNNVHKEYENRVHISLTSKDMKIPYDIRVKSPFLDNYFCLMEKYNMAFVAIAKNAMTYLKNLAIHAQYDIYPAHEDVHNLIGYNERSPYLCPVREMKKRETELGKMIKFAVWRDPVERLVSCYKFFCLEKENRYYFRYLDLYGDNSFDRFMEFVRFELGKTNPLYQDEHIRRQSDYYSPEDVDYIVPIKFLNRFLEEHNIPVPQKEANKTTVDFKLANHYIDEIKDLYKNDYKIESTYNG